MTASSPHVPDPVGDRQDAAQRERFLAETLAARGNEQARALLEAEWRYLGPLTAHLPKGARVLDLACGSGAQARAWAERGYHVYGAELDLALLRQGAERSADAVRGGATLGWLCSDATRLPCATGSIDIVFCNSLLEHVPDWRGVLREIARVLKSGGVVILYTTNRACPLQQEVRNFPFYSWLPDPIQRRVLAWIMANRRDLVGWTEFPAVNWFTFGGLGRAYRDAGLEPFDRLDLLEQQGRGGLLVKLMNRVPLLKLPYQVYAISMALYGKKR